MNEPQLHVSPRAGMGCLAKILIAISIGFLLLAILAAVAWTQKEQIGKWIAAEVVDITVTTKLEELRFPPDEQEDIRAAVALIKDEIQSEDFRPEQAQELLQNPRFAPELGAVAVQGFRHRYLQEAGLEEAELDEALQTVSRFQDATLRRQVHESIYRELGSIALADEEQMLFKESLNRDEIDRILRIMREQADRAGVPQQTIEIDPAAELRRAVEQALQERTPEPPPIQDGESL